MGFAEISLYVSIILMFHWEVSQAKTTTTCKKKKINDKGNMSEIVILPVCFQLKQLKKQPEKNSGLNKTRTHDLAMPVQCSIH